MKIKICGITKPQEARYLNEAGADYAGFVFFAKSKRNVTVDEALAIQAELHPSIKRVAVTVAPDRRLVERIEDAGFDILQVHQSIDREILEHVHIPVWFAVNIADEVQLTEKIKFLEELPDVLFGKIEAIVVDGADYGSGKTFDWQQSEGIRGRRPFAGRKFVLAGGLNEENVTEGIRRFQPDIVDVSSGVEGMDGKDQDKINGFIRKVRDYE